MGKFFFAQGPDSNEFTGWVGGKHRGKLNDKGNSRGTRGKGSKGSKGGKGNGKGGGSGKGGAADGWGRWT